MLEQPAHALYAMPDSPYRPLTPTEFKQRVAEVFDRRTEYDNEGDFHPNIARRLVELADLQPGQQVLDVGTGTGLVAIAAAQQVRSPGSSQGWVVGVDLSPGMLAQAQCKITALKLFNISLHLADVETLNLPDACFDVVFCSSALIFLTDISAALQRWYKTLKPGGLIGFHGFADTAFVAGIVTQQVAKRYGVELQFNQPTGTREKCYALLQEAGFEQIDIIAEQFGSYISLRQAKQVWSSDLTHPLLHPLRQLSAPQLMRVKADFFAELEARTTTQGIWNDILTYFALGRKPG